MQKVMCEEKGCEQSASVHKIYEDGEESYTCLEHLGVIKHNKMCVSITVFKWEIE